MHIRRTTYWIIAFLVCFSCIGRAEIITQYYTFNKPNIEKIRIDTILFDRLKMENAPNGGMPGQPSLPAMGARILLPFNCIVENISVSTNEKVLLGKNFKVEPVGEPIPLSLSSQKNYPPTPDMSIYGVNDVFPAKNFDVVGVHSFRGYQILILKLLPVEYHPVSGELYYTPTLIVRLNITDSNKNSQLFRGLIDDELDVMNRIDNAIQIDSYRENNKNRSKNYDLLILTASSMADYFLPLKNYHDSTGVLTEIHTIENIGSNNPDIIRDYIRDVYQNDGISYVLIGGDDDIIPAKDLYTYTWETGSVAYDMPGDIYFSCLDGTFNYDGDARWGEINDGENGDDVDLIAEVYVGRAPVGDSFEAERFVNKTINYLSNQNSQLDKVLLAGGRLGFGGLGEYGGYSMDELIDDNSTYGYSTTGIPSDQFSIDKLYDLYGIWSNIDIANKINEGQHIVNHLGHSNINYALKLSSSDVISLLNNTDLCFIYSQGCLAGHFDGTDCWAEYMTVKSDHGAFATINNARYGLGGFFSADGASQRYNREFWDAVFKPSEGIPEIGRANHDSKEDNLYRINEAGMRWLYYGITLFGDPAVPILNLQSLIFNYPSGIPEIVVPGQETSIVVVVNGLGNGIPVSGTGQFHFRINGGYFQTIDMTESASNEYVVSIPALACGDYLECFFSAEESASGLIFDPPATDPYIIKAGLQMVTIFDDDFETDKGWSVSGGLWERGTPTGQGGNPYTGPDPSSGHSGQNVFGYNLNGNYENNLGEMHLTSPAIDCSILVNTHLKFWRWLGVEVPPFDHSYIRVSNNGTDWVTVWQHPSEVWDVEWNYMDIDISAIADGQSTVYLRWTMGTTDEAVTYFGWNVDDVELTGHVCDSNWLFITTSSLPDWTAEYPYSYQLEVIGDTTGIIWTDKYNELDNTGLVLYSSGLLSGIVDSAQEISFVAVVTNDQKNTNEKVFSFAVNQALDIETDSLPSGVINEFYSYQLISSGGTGAINWTDKNGDLTETGLSLSENGYLSGIPSEESPITFIALIWDSIGASFEKQFSLEIYGGYICGDVDGNELVNILDITFLIAYLYKDGLAPNPLESADVNGSGTVNILDVTYLISYLYNDGPKPICT